MSGASLAIAKGVLLPAATAAVQTFGAIGRKGSGKTYTAGVIVEQLMLHSCPCIVFDPVGNWYGLRLNAAGTGPGLSIPVLGGRHGDIPLDETSGETVARFIIERNSSAVIDVSEFRKNARKRFVTDFAETLFHEAKARRTPRMVVFEEAQLFAPQMAKGEERMLGAIEDIVRLGRNYGLGSMLITQRPQSVNKEVLNQVECLLVGQLSGAHERKAIGDWIVAKGETELSKKLAELPSLKRGEFFLWSPQWLETFERVSINKKTTYDASATPELGEELVAQPLAPIDVAALSAAMGDALEHAKANDPKALRATIDELNNRVADLKREADRESEAAVDVGAIEDYRRENAELTNKLDRLEREVEDVRRMWPNNVRGMLHTLRSQLSEVFDKTIAGVTGLDPYAAYPQPGTAAAGERELPDPMKRCPRSPVGHHRMGRHNVYVGGFEAGKGFTDSQCKSCGAKGAELTEWYKADVGEEMANRRTLGEREEVKNGRVPHEVRKAIERGAYVHMPVNNVPAALSTNGQGLNFGKAERAILVVLIQQTAPVRLERLAILAGYHANTKTFRNALGSLSSGGYLERGTGAYAASAKARKEVRDVPPLPRGRGLLEHYQARVGKAGRGILGALWDKPATLTELAHALGYHENTKTFRNELGKLRTMGLIVGGPGAPLSIAPDMRR